MLDYRRRESLAQLSLPNLLDFPLITGRRIPSVFFLLFPSANFWPTLVPTLTERVTATRNFAAVSLAIVTRDEC